MSDEKLFGTDGIRGRANKVLTADLAVKIGQAAGIHFRRGSHRHQVLLGKDPRLSSYMLEQALTAGLLSVGVKVLLTGPIPTPGVAALTPSMRADLGVMISASHNLYEDNGIKLFGPDGFKLSDGDQHKIEMLIHSDLAGQLADAHELGRAERIDGAQDRYIVLAKRVVPGRIDFEGLRVIVDCANGAAYKVAPQALRELGAEVFAIGDTPDGVNINRECGSTDTRMLIREVVGRRADVGLAFDGDADRIIVIDEKGQEVSGDQLLALIALAWKREHKDLSRGVVGTLMTNGGLERYFHTLGIPLLRSQVGDRYVLEMMREHECILGGEQSGHIIMSEFATTGDGLMAALQVLSIMKMEGKPLSALTHCFEPLPQMLQNVRAPARVLEAEAVRALLREIETNAEVRFVVRPSGTEPLIRVMGEGENRNQVALFVQRLVTLIDTEGRSS
jgi:phosphoglucosamine mutase